MSENYSAATLYIILLVFLLIMQLIAGAYLSIRTGKLRELLSFRLHDRLLKRLYRTEWMAINKYHNGDIQTRLVSDVGNIVEGWTATLPGIIAMAIQLVVAFFTLWYYDATLAIFAFMLGPITLFLSWLIGRKLKRMQHEIQSAESSYRSFLLENVRHMLIIKTFQYENSSMQQMENLQQHKLNWVVKRNFFNAMTNLSIGFGYQAGFFLAFVLGAYKIARGATSFGTFTAFLQLVGHIQGPLQGLSRSLPMIIATLASVERLKEFDALQSEPGSEQYAQPIKELASINFEGVSYAYETNVPILQEISFSVKPGEIIAIVGTSGEGKTTLLRLLLALLQPREGRAFVRTSSAEELAISAATRSYFSYVPQGNTLFSGTVLDNIRIGNPDATEDAVIEAARHACAWEFITKLPLGLHTVIGDNGVGLSEGQAQRIAIARALLRPAPILLLDEATSALDLDTEVEVLERIKRLAPQKTCIAITHRLSVIDICNRVYRVRDHKLVEIENGSSTGV
ncbi:ABC-type multidrug transport system fused ATPase/permease subunit [Paenibacillus methanolicus]|uniref:ABC-type multidrug transport system fused ATPase/permease subunit n=2 Tax=Paenibacillus methanolicus TaxID=582686 RepID=A0A5S5BPM8_9BACL|nr:ABC-type multidrug transport system fused ATPase/permease subunit [Paenibacillus methanolicus]